MQNPLMLTIDIGNSNITLGVFEGSRLLETKRLITSKDVTLQEYSAQLTTLLSTYFQQKVAWKGAAICSVVKPLTEVFFTICAHLLGQSVVIITPQSSTGIQVLTDHPSETGTDRIVNAAAAFALYGGPTVVIDLGTATTFDVVTESGSFVGGAIATGVGLMADVLHSRTSQLPIIPLEFPACAIGRNTISAMQSGVVLGYISLIEGMVARLENEIGEKLRVILTGGYAVLFNNRLRMEHCLDPHLTLKGCRLIFDMHYNPKVAER